MVNITREYYTRFIASFLCCISDTEGCQYPGIRWIFFKSVVLNSAATGFQAPFQGRPLLGLILTHLPSQTEAALPLSCPSQSLTWCPGQSVAYIPFMPQIQHPSSHDSCPWSGSAYSSFLKKLTGGSQNCFACSAQHRLAISPHAHH